ncbi:hypothetical protein [Tychonema sp. LEGE 07203]|uniref:hypothetical protein n=1 Tax=Tychonema sp. LEGE 07203 TaxID=1828671 RepID=UPI001881C040|nr:hypothetical protein [Tychonema sp. LEGE 07203]MBE9095905.1 hypothetical protein [Tychonema sp. LEGE 07203]
MSSSRNIQESPCAAGVLPLLYRLYCDAGSGLQKIGALGAGTRRAIGQFLAE